MAVRKGLKLNEYGLFRREDGQADRRRDRGGGLRAALGCRGSRRRCARTAARSRRRSRARSRTCSQRKELRGDLHTHTNLTDGLASLEQMVAAAAELRYAYYAVTDHAPNLSMQRMTDEKMLAQRERAPGAAGVVPEDDPAARHRAEHRRRRRRGLGRRLPGGVRRLRRVGALALQPAHGRDDPAHRPGDGEPVRQRHRPPHRPHDRQAPADRVDLEAVFEAAARTGTALEVNGYPGPARPAGRAHPVGAAPRGEVRGRHRLARRPRTWSTCATASAPRSAAG